MSKAIRTDRVTCGDFGAIDTPPQVLQTLLVGRNTIVLLSLLGTCLLGLIGCSKPLNNSTIENRIRDSVIQQGGVSLKAVSCPNDIKPAAGERFDCLGTLDSGGTFAIPVEQKDAQGTVQWEIPSVRGLVNVAKLEVLLQETLTSEVRTALRVECGDAYRAVRPGESFDCKVQAVAKRQDASIAPSAKATSQTKPRLTGSIVPEKIVITMDAEGNVNWQEVLPKTQAVNVASAATRSNAAEQTGQAKVKRKAPVTLESVPDADRPGDSDVVVE